MNALLSTVTFVNQFPTKGADSKSRLSPERHIPHNESFQSESDSLSASTPFCKSYKSPGRIGDINVTEQGLLTKGV
ncbi:hypothetical protein KOW79_016005 [Hemibagrus wyckioides]|uniref:Uncharacterized protein n=1 Tax=Hemibagrus wyckioides TaxID=337641 RepID=A0A9D3SDI4_9TELE|nr:hypothetical protein KOW79_016005 [Hemibagrus wyckioides]